MGLYYGRPGDNSWQTILAQMPDQEFNNLTRSTIPMLSWWQDAEDRWSALDPLELGPYSDGDVCVEYPVPSFGRAKASFTDVMFIGPSASAAFEGKSTEGRYETVARWLSRGGDNRQHVLDHWLSCIGKRPGEVDRGLLDQCVYQMLHRTASVCALERGEQRHVVYQYFKIESAPPSRADYHRDLVMLAQALRPTERLKFWVVTVPTTRTTTWLDISQQASAAPTLDQRADLVRNAISARTLFEFGPATVDQVTE